MKILKRFFIDGLSGMAQGLFAPSLRREEATSIRVKYRMAVP